MYLKMIKLLKTGVRITRMLTDVLNIEGCNFFCSVRRISTFKNIHKTDQIKQDLKNINERELQIRHLFVRCCVDFWDDYRIGVIFDTAYVDSHADSAFNPEIPVIVFLHNTPGSSADLLPLLQPLSNLGYRVIAPDFPGCGLTKGIGPYDDNTFRGHTDERANFLDNFLSTLGIERIDMLVGCGSGCNTAVSYTSNILQTLKNIKSLALINPAGHRNSSPEDFKSIEEFAYLWDQKPFTKLPLYLALVVATYTRLKFLQQFPLKHRKHLMIHVSGFQYEVVTSDSTAIGYTSLPRLLIYSKGDRLFVNDEIMQEYTDILGIPKSNICECSSDGKITSPQTNNSALKGVIFDEKPDSLLLKCKGQLLLLLLDLLKTVIKKKL